MRFPWVGAALVAAAFTVAAAVAEERARLSEEIDRSVRRSLGRVAGLAREALEAADSRPALVQIQTETRGTMQELRRQLGLIGEGLPPVAGPTSAVPPLRSRPGTRDLVLVGAVLLLVAVDQLIPGTEPHLGSWLMSSAMALTLLWRRVAPVTCALAGILLLAAGVVLDAPVADGFSFPLMIGLLLWSVLQQRLSPSTVLAAAALWGVAVASRWANDPENGPINVVILGVVVVAAVAHAAVRRAGDTSRERAAEQERRLAQAREHAVADDRQVLARELHDVASHAVALVAVQAGAAELAWERNPAEAREGLRSVLATVDGALEELSARCWGAAPTRGWDDVLATVARLRGAGLQVELRTLGPTPPDDLMPTVHRVVQESLTNVLKHAPDAPVTVRVSTDGTATEVEVTDDGPVRVLLVDDHEMMRAGLAGVLAADPDIEVVGEAGDGAAAVAEARRTRPDVVLMDVEMPEVDGITAIGRLRQTVPESRSLVLTTFDLDDYVIRALRAGATGFLLKTTPPRELIRAVKECAAGGSALGPTVVSRLVENYVNRVPTPAP